MVIPAIDIKDGKCVRLTKGVFGTEKVYFDDPVEVAKMFKSLGISRIHVVDLDGASKGKPENLKAIEKIVATGLKVELGGGVRDRETVKKLIDIGVNWVIMGTVIVEDFELFSIITEEFPERVIAGVDVKDGKVATRGWKELSEKSLNDVIKRVGKTKVESIIVTDIARDGTLEGVNTKLVRNIVNISQKPIIVSGGVKGIEDIISLLELKSEKIKGIIVGKAIYEGKVDLKELLKIMKNKDAC